MISHEPATPLVFKPGGSGGTPGIPTRSAKAKEQSFTAGVGTSMLNGPESKCSAPWRALHHAEMTHRDDAFGCGWMQLWLQRRCPLSTGR